MDKYFTIQRLIEIQKERKEAVEKVFIDVLSFLPKFEIDFRLEDKRKDLLKLNIKNQGISFLVKIKLKDKSSVKFVVNQNKQKILEEYSKIFVKDFLVIN
jgi:NAD-specific glutamate dehydrogenase